MSTSAPAPRQPIGDDICLARDSETGIGHANDDMGDAPVHRSEDVQRY